MERNNKKHVFVTVGSTFFDELISVVCSAEFLECLLKHGYNSISVQKGKGKTPKFSAPKNFSEVEIYDYKPTLKPDMEKADLIISHCGAGCIMESLALFKPVIAVVNDTLQGNHQHELADSLFEMGLIIKTSHKKILTIVKKQEFGESLGNLKKIEKPATEKFSKYVYEAIGI